MSYEIFPNYDQGRLFSDTAEFQVPADHPVQFLRTFVDELPLEELGFPVRHAKVGRPNYSSNLLLKAWIYGYIYRITSCRALEDACKRDRYLGYLIGWHHPDHSTLNNFWSNNQAAIGEVFKRSVIVADHQNMIGHAVQAVDGTKIPARCSQRTAWSQSELEDKLDLVEKAIVDIEQEIASNEAEAIQEQRLPHELIDKQAMRAKIKESLQWLEDNQKVRNKTTNKKAHPGEPEADQMISTRGGMRLSYNGQAVADDAHQIVVAADLDNECHDKNQLTKMVGQARENTRRDSAMTIADAGYHKLTELHKARQMGYDVLVNNSEQRKLDQNPFHSHHFKANPQTLEVICPQTTTSLDYVYTAEKQGDLENVRVYRCRNRECPLRSQCSSSSNGKEIKVSDQHWALYKQISRHKTNESSYWFRQRKVIVEPVFAHIKYMMGDVRFSFRGMAKARIQFLMYCTTHNLKKVIKEWQKQFSLGSLSPI